MQAAAKFAVAQHLVPRLTVKYANNQALPQPGVVAFNQLVQVDHVSYMFSTFSGVLTATAPLANRDEVVQVNGGGVGANLGHLGAYTINDIPLINDEISTLLPYLKSKGHHGGMDVIYTNDALGTGAYQTLQKDWPAQGGTIIHGYEISPTATDFTSIASQISSDHPNIVYVASYGTQQMVIVKELRAAGVNAQIVGYSGFDYPGTATASYDQGVIFTSENVNYQATNNMTTGFLKQWRRSHSSLPSYYQVNSANSVLLYAELAKYVTAHHESLTGKNLLSAFHAKRTYDLIGGEITFRSNGTVKMPIEINQIRNGHIVVVKK
jgi:ABC-type branched-subunit amino acid transport system substrate-binding protein